MFNPINAVKGALAAMKFVTVLQKWLSGKKTYLSAAAIAVPALVEVINLFADNGLRAIGGISKTEAWAQLFVAIGLMSGRAAIAKAGNPKEDPNHQKHAQKAS